ncbi:MAG: type II secretion system protein [Planctomycetota bacterium]
MRKGFSITELMVALGVMAVAFLITSTIFKISVDTQRTAHATAEVMRKFRAITDQLNTDLAGLREDGEVFVAWVPADVNRLGDQDVDEDFDGDGYARFDRIMFFADGDFQSYNEGPKTSGGTKIARGNIARICYMLARTDDGSIAQMQQRKKRVLARTQHIMTADEELEDFFAGVGGFSDQDWVQWNNHYEYDRMTIGDWKNLGRLGVAEVKDDMFTTISGVRVNDSNVMPIGAQVNDGEPNSIHMLLCDGVGEFEVQLWSDSLRRWVPAVDPNNDGDLADTDFRNSGGTVILDSNEVLGAWYDGMGNLTGYLGRAMKFTFTLYDSRRVLKNGKTFTHIVYLDD